MLLIQFYDFSICFNQTNDWDGQQSKGKGRGSTMPGIIASI